MKTDALVLTIRAVVTLVGTEVDRNVCMQTLMRENKEQYFIISELQKRVEHVEEELQRRSNEQARRSWWKASHGASVVAGLEPPKPVPKEQT